ncbi:MAG: NERD domain-containing protein [Betaproteobacteria bacterium]|nr:NERD domain-containing protein [Betaproteobacteria bacterium]
MARMFPSQIAASSPRGERAIFHKLRDDPATIDWVVFHSLDIKRHVSRMEGELDFVIAVPGQGIVCVEIKGCGVSRRDGTWIYDYDPPKISSIGPFKQASEAMHSLRQYLGGRDAALRNVVFVSAVFFTVIDFAQRTPEWEPWQNIGVTDLTRRPISAIVTGILDAAHAKLRNRSAESGRCEALSDLTRPRIDALIKLLRPDCEYIPSPSMVVEGDEAVIRRFTEEQFRALDLIEENPRLLFKGLAGTGKTLLAIETAKRAVRAGKRTELLCFNKLLGDWLREATKDIAEEARRRGSRFTVGTLSSLMLHITGRDIPAGADRAYWEHDLPESAIEKLLNGPEDAWLHDVLVLDEAQDLLKDPFLDVLDVTLDGGISAGQWAIFGDFERQAIFADGEASSMLDKLKARAGAGYAGCGLRINCRNSMNIADGVTVTSGLAPGYSGVLQDVEGDDVRALFWRDMNEQVGKLSAIVASLLRRFAAAQIVILSPRSDAHCCASSFGGQIACKELVPLRASQSAGGDAIRYGSIHAFKGLEAAAVVLTDVDGLDDEQDKALMYVGMTRARLSLHLLMRHDLAGKYRALIFAGLRKVERDGNHDQT